MDKVAIAVGVAVLFVVLRKVSGLLTAKRRLNLPPGPWTLPLIGSLHHLVRSPVVYRGMRDLADKYGPLMMLRVGEMPTLVVSSPEAAKAIMKTHDIKFADRYTSVIMGILTSDIDSKDPAFGKYGERWRQLRKISVQELLSVARVQSFHRIREDEVARFMQSLAASAGAGATVNLTKMFAVYMNDLSVRESIGSRCRYQDEYLDAIDTAILQTSGVSLADLFPSSRLMRALGTAPRKALACRRRIDSIIEEIISEKKEAMERGDETAHDGFIGVLLRLQKEASLPIPLTNGIIVRILFDMFGAGSETSSTSLNWCMTELARHPEVMAKAQAEVREAFKGKSTITEEDLTRAKLSYLNLVIKEIMRLHPPLPLLLPRQCRETCQVLGYDIPKGTTVLINAWAICRDPKYWDDPEEFKPERFEKSSLDYKGADFEFTPFGSGRRMCPGLNLGVANMELALASLLYHFDWKLPDGVVEPKDLDASENIGVVAKKKTELVLRPVTCIAPAS